MSLRDINCRDGYAAVRLEKEVIGARPMLRAGLASFCRKHCGGENGCYAARYTVYTMGDVVRKSTKELANEAAKAVDAL